MGHSNNKSSQKNKGQKQRKEGSNLMAGVAGGCIVILIICLIASLKPGFIHANYYICEDPSMLKALLTTDLNSVDSAAVSRAIQEEEVRRQDAIEDLLEQKIIVSSEDFASNISGYYNALIAVLSSILIILNLVGYFSWRSNANSSLAQKQMELESVIDRIDTRLENNLEEILRKNQIVKERLEEYFRDLLEQREMLTEEEWEKLHLLLTKYEKQEVLKAIKADDDEKNDGVIEQ